MPRKHLKGWEGSPAFRWSKTIDGKRHRVTCDQLGLPRSEWTEERSSQAAQDHWRRLFVELNRDPVADAVATLPDEERLLAMIRAGHFAELANVIRHEHANEEVMGEPFGVLEPLGTEEERASSIVHVAEQLSPPAPKEFSLSYHVARFVAKERARVRPDGISENTYGEVQHITSLIERQLGSSLDVRTINESVVEDFHSWLSSSGRDSKKRLWRYFRRLVNYFFMHRLIELPRNLNDNTLSFEAKKTTPPRLDTTKLVESLACITPRQRLYALLALNCAMYGSDMAALTWDQWKGGRITYKRQKTEGETNVPTVSYLLWPETERLLRECQSEHDTLVLTSMRNTPLWSQRIDETGKMKKSDLITQQWSRSGCPFLLRQMRHVSATILSDGEFARYADHFLGHAPQATAAKFYVAAPTEEAFDAAVRHIGQTLGFVKVANKKVKA